MNETKTAEYAEDAEEEIPKDFCGCGSSL